MELDDKRETRTAALGSLKQHPRISAFRRFIEGWYISYFNPDAARSLPLAGPQKHLNVHGEDPRECRAIHGAGIPRNSGRSSNAFQKRSRGSTRSIQRELLMDACPPRFNDKGFQDPFYAQQMSDGTLKIFAYLLLLEDPAPPPFLCIEEPENGLYHKLLETLAKEFREHATGQTQVFVTTHQPYFVDALTPEEVWILEKGKMVSRPLGGRAMSNTLNESRWPR